MQKQKLFFGIKANKLIISVFVYCLLSVAFGDYNSTVSAADYSLSLTSSGSQSIDIAAAGTKTAISADNINVSTTCRYGYNFTINTSVNNNNLYLNGNSSNNASGTYFTPVNGTTALKDSANTWGYYYNNAAPTTAPTVSNVFNAVPTLNNPATIRTPLTTPSSTDINDNFNIYYGVSSSDTMPIGTYKMIPDTNNSNNDGTIVYTATIADACIAYTVHFNPTSYFNGVEITGAGTMSDQTIYEGIPTALSNLTFSNPTTISGIDYYFTGWNTAQDGSGTSYINTEDVLDLTSAGNNVTLYAMWTDCPNNKICYSSNVSNSNDIEGEMGDQTISTSATSIDLYAPNFKHDGYGFVSWNTKPNGTGTNYGPQQTIEFTAGQYNTGGLRLYANWKVSQGNMQNWSGCSNMNISDVTALKDTRDNDVYAVAKLADGKCWMIENLRLDDSVTLSSSNTNNPSLPLTNVYDTNATSNHLSPTSSVAYNASTAPEGWCETRSAACYDQSRLRTDNTTLFATNISSDYNVHNNVYSYGNYYNWYSATAGHGKYGSSYGSGYNTPGDICPVGWHLPKGGDKVYESTNEFWALMVNGLNNSIKPANYDTSTAPYYTYREDNESIPIDKALRSYPNNFIYSGSTWGSSISRNYNGSYWSASAVNSFNASEMRFYSDYVYPMANHDKYFGKSVRCVIGS